MFGPPISASGTTLQQISVLPQPFQKPHPPLWEPLNSERTIRWAAKNGLNGNFIFESDRAMKPKIDIYMEASAEAGWPNGGEFKSGWDTRRHRGVSSGRVVHIVDPALSHCDAGLEPTESPALSVGLLQAVRLHRDPGRAGRDAADGRRA